MSIRRFIHNISRLVGAALRPAAGVGALAAVLFLGGACERSAKTPTSRSASTTTAEQLPADLFVKVEPAGARSVLEVRRDAKVGDVVVVRGRIGGSKSPFVEGRAMFTLTDLSLPPCNANPDDKCATPWDYCCEPADRIAAHSLTAQVSGKDGTAIRQGLDTLGQLRPLTDVVVSGEVLRTDSQKYLVLSISHVYCFE